MTVPPLAACRRFLGATSCGGACLQDVRAPAPTTSGALGPLPTVPSGLPDSLSFALTAHLSVGGDRMMVREWASVRGLQPSKVGFAARCRQPAGPWLLDCPGLCRSFLLFCICTILLLPHGTCSQVRRTTRATGGHFCPLTSAVLTGSRHLRRLVSPCLFSRCGPSVQRHLLPLHQHCLPSSAALAMARLVAALTVLCIVFAASSVQARACGELAGGAGAGKLSGQPPPHDEPRRPPPPRPRSPCRQRLGCRPPAEFQTSWMLCQAAGRRSAVCWPHRLARLRRRW